MKNFVAHTQESAPAAAQETMSQVEAAFGFVPNLIGVMAESPPLAEAYLTLSGLFDKTSLSPVERQVVLLAASRENACEYCMASHTTIARMSRMPETVIDALRDGTGVPDARLEALRRFTVAVVRQRGWVDEAEVDAFREAGYSKANVLDVILGVGMKTLSNYTNHVADTPLDRAFAVEAWQRPLVPSSRPWNNESPPLHPPGDNDVVTERME